MCASMWSMEGVGPAALEVFETAGLREIWQLNAFDAEDCKLNDAICKIRNARDCSMWDDARRITTIAAAGTSPHPSPAAPRSRLRPAVTAPPLKCGCWRDRARSSRCAACSSNRGATMHHTCPRRRCAAPSPTSSHASALFSR